MPARREPAGVSSLSEVEMIVQALERGGDNMRAARRSGGDVNLTRRQVLSDGGGDGRLGALARADEVDGAGLEAESICVSRRAEVVHLVVEDDA